MKELSNKFGFKTVTPQEKNTLVNQVFSSVSHKYDLMNDIMSAGIHRLWKKELINSISPYDGMYLIDMASGTGDVSQRFLKESIQKKHYKSKVCICDQNYDMLQQGQMKIINSGITQNIEFVCTDATKTPFTDDTFDTYTISFGLRNVTHIELAIQEAYRILKPGGKFLCLEFAKINAGKHTNLLRKVYDFYSFNIIPQMGQIIADDKQSYQYLAESINLFPAQQELEQIIQLSGFSKVSWRNLTCGIVAIHTGIKL